MCLLICYKLNRIQNSKMTSFQKIYNDSQVHNLVAWLLRDTVKWHGVSEQEQCGKGTETN